MRVDSGRMLQAWADPTEEPLPPTGPEQAQPLSAPSANDAQASPQPEPGASQDAGPGSGPEPSVPTQADPWSALPPASWQLMPAQTPTAVPVVPTPLPSDEPEPLPEQAPRDEDAGNRMEDFAFIERHEARAQELERYWAQVSALSNFRAGVGQGEQTYAAEMTLANLRPPAPEEDEESPEPPVESPEADADPPPEPEPQPQVQPQPEQVSEAGPEPSPATTAWQGVAFDDEGNLMPGVLDPSLSPEQQQAQLVAQLQAQGLDLEDAVLLTYETLLADAAPATLPPSAESRSWTPEEQQARLDEVDRHLQEELQAQQARADSLLSAADLQQPTGGPSNRALPIQPVLNGNFEAALNAAADVAGLLQPLADLRGALGQLQAVQAESRIESLRAAMRAAGMSQVPEGFERAWVTGGAMVKDYGATTQRLQAAYQDFLTDRRHTETWGSNWRDLRIGRAQMTVQEFETTVLRVQQQATNEAYERGRMAIARGELPIGQLGYAHALGSYIDTQVRRDLRDFGQSQGLPDSAASNLFAVNRVMRGAGMAGIPDMRLGSNLISDVSLAPKNGSYEQLQRWNSIRPSDPIIIRPEAMPGGGSYVVPRATIGPVVPPKKGG